MIRSSGSLRNFCRNNADRTKVFGHRTTVNEKVIRQAMRDEELQTELHRLCKQETSNAESNYNYNNKHEDIYTCCCDPTEQICVTLLKRMETIGIVMRTSFGFKTLIVNMKLDAWNDGVM